MTLGEKLRQARINKNYSQEYMAEVLEISQKTYSNFENDKTSPNFSQIEKISTTLEVSILDFLTDNKPSFNYSISGGNNNNGYVVNQIPEKLIEQYELRIKKLEEENKYLKSVLDRMIK
ncbi:helix-turn-helix domain-containing protein [Riemerella columbipharyngis]|uniref:Transcriptional regulator, contains XRE-family HTH domain n=1 Tax=Riemerella columbipharyngis TaxID=1071918 RepID=A0A1G7EEQ4_9FLAO|nr:helix-turn-helix transcriptional regulator [Riemerella columbipharyngis]SDE62133.1 Transcriptional regulator, contains XRE-family HTH domain [Riemerella columbipharyngis]